MTEEIKFKYIEPIEFEVGDFPQVNSAGEIIGMVRQKVMTLEEFKKLYPKD
jgi:hypothetical protein